MGTRRLIPGNVTTNVNEQSTLRHAYVVSPLRPEKEAYRRVPIRLRLLRLSGRPRVL